MNVVPCLFVNLFMNFNERLCFVEYYRIVCAFVIEYSHTGKAVKWFKCQFVLLNAETLILEHRILNDLNIGFIFPKWNWEIISKMRQKEEGMEHREETKNDNHNDNFDYKVASCVMELILWERFCLSQCLKHVSKHGNLIGWTYERHDVA